MRNLKKLEISPHNMDRLIWALSQPTQGKQEIKPSLLSKGGFGFKEQWKSSNTDVISVMVQLHWPKQLSDWYYTKY